MNEGEKGSDATKQELSRMDPYFILFFIFLYESLVLNFTLATLLRNPLLVIPLSINIKESFLLVNLCLWLCSTFHRCYFYPICMGLLSLLNS